MCSDRAIDNLHVAHFYELEAKKSEYSSDMKKKIE